MEDGTYKLQMLAFEWGTRCFGKDHMINQRIRSLRHAEEAIELAQVCGVELELMHKLVDVVYSRPHGLPRAELGGSLLTAGVLTLILTGESINEILYEELRRCLRADPEDFAKRNQEKIGLGLA